MKDYEEAIIEVANFLKQIQAYEDCFRLIKTGIISPVDLKLNKPNIHTFIEDLKTKYKIERIK